jgi:hypothetical protein
MPLNEGVGTVVRDIVGSRKGEIVNAQWVDEAQLGEITRLYRERLSLSQA